MAKIPKYEWKVDLEDSSQGVKVISIVDEPAMETDFIAFQKNTKPTPKMVKFEVDGYKQIVAGLSMIPDKDIPRVDADGSPYIGYFSAETIEDIRNKFHKEMMTNNVNVNHEADEVVDAYLIESFIINSEKQVEDLQDKGIEEATIGAWFTAYKIEDEEVFQQVLDGELNGFSVELYAERILKSAKNNYNKLNKKTVMSKLLEKLNSIIDEAKKAVNEFSEEEATAEKFERSPVPELEIIIEWDEIGNPVNSVVTSEDGAESLEPVEDGEYVIEDGRTLVVTDGVLAEVRDAEAEEEETPSETDEPAEEEMSTEEEVKAEAETTEDVEAAEEETDATDGKKSLEELIDLSQDGYYTVEVIVEGGAFTYGAVYANTYKDLKFNSENFEKVIEDNETLKSDNEDLTKEVEELKKKIKEPITNPKLGFEKKETKEEVDVSKLSAYQKVLHKRGLPIV